MTLTHTPACPACGLLLTPTDDGRRFECRHSKCPEAGWKPEEVIDV